MASVPSARNRQRSSPRFSKSRQTCSFNSSASQGSTGSKVDSGDPFRSPWSLAGLNRSDRVATAMPMIESRYALGQIEPMFLGKERLSQSRIRIPRLPVMIGTKRDRGKVRRLLSHPPPAWKLVCAASITVSPPLTRELGLGVYSDRDLHDCHAARCGRTSERILASHSSRAVSSSY